MSWPLPLRKLRCRHCGSRPVEFTTQGLVWFALTAIEKDIRLANNFFLAFACGRTVEHDPDWPQPRTTTPCSWR